jgi:hypothetical protein
MSEKADDTVDPATAHEWCRRYTPGHRVHWIQAKRALRGPGTAYRLVGASDQRVTVHHEGTGAEEVWRLHDARRVVAAALLAGTSTVHLHEHGLLAVSMSDGARTCFHPCRAPEQWRPCSADESGGAGGIRIG